MTDSSQDTGVIVALVERFTEQRLPRAIAIKERVDQGQRLSEQDISFLEQVLSDAEKIKPLVDRHPEWQELVAKAVQLYQEITEKALQNEQGSQD